MFTTSRGLYNVHTTKPQILSNRTKYDFVCTKTATHAIFDKNIICLVELMPLKIRCHYNNNIIRHESLFYTLTPNLSIVSDAG